MKNIILVSLMISLISSLFAQKKDIQAWKAEKSIETQHNVFVKNASYWDGYFMFKQPQLDDYHKAVVDTVANLEQKISDRNQEIIDLKGQIEKLTNQYNTSQENLNQSLSNESSLTTLGIQFDKTTFPPLVYTIIIVLFIVCGIGFGLFFRSNAVTKETLKVQNNLQEELTQQKKRALERETKLNRELQTERNKRH